MNIPDFEIVSTSYQIIDPETEEETVLCAHILCPRVGCDRVFIVDLNKWARPWYHEYKNNLMMGRSCPYCYGTSHVPEQAYEILGIPKPPLLKDG